MGNKLVSLVCRIIFIASFLLLGLSIIEKIVNSMGLTLIRGYFAPWHLIEFSAIALLFVIALQLREIKLLMAEK